MVKALEDFDASSLLVELLERAKEGEIDLTEALWDRMEPDERQIRDLCEENDVQLFDQEDFDATVADAVEDAMIGSDLFRLAARIAFVPTTTDLVTALRDIKHVMQKEYNLYQGRLL